MAQQDVESAIGSLISTLKSGEKQLYEQALALSRKCKRFGQGRTSKQKEAIKQTTQQLDQFLHSLEQQHQPMLDFIDCIQSADDFFEQGEWFKAQTHYRQAKQLHQEDFLLTEDGIIHKIELCQLALQHDYHLDLGQECIEQEVWNKALSHFHQAKSYLHEELPFSEEPLDMLIDKVNQHQAFEHHFLKAQGLQSQRNWEQAAFAYQYALSLHQDGMNPGKEWLTNTIEGCQERAKTSSAHIISRISHMWKKSSLQPIWWISALVVLVLYFWLSQPNMEYNTPNAGETLPSATVAEQEEAIPPSSVSAAPPAQQENNQTVLNTETQRMVPPVTQEVESIDKPVDIREPAPALPSAPVGDELIYQERQIWAEIDEDMKVNQQRSISSPAPTEVSETASTSELVVASDTIEAESVSIQVSEQKALFQKIAVIPFCDGLNDPKLIRRLYLDASFSLSRHEREDLRAISKNTVKGMMNQLGLPQHQSCSKLHNSKLGRAIEADYLLTGSVEKLAGEEIQIHCKILQPHSGTFSKEFTIADKNIQTLREKFKNEIPKIVDQSL